MAIASDTGGRVCVERGIAIITAMSCSPRSTFDEVSRTSRSALCSTCSADAGARSSAASTVAPAAAIKSEVRICCSLTTMRLEDA